MRKRPEMRSRGSDKDDDGPKIFTDKKSRTITYIGDINWNGAADFIQQFQELERGGDILVKLCTHGGDVDPGMAIYETIRMSERHIEIRVIGTCQSMGTVILQAADLRTITAQSTLMHHRGTTSNSANLSPDEHASISAFEAQMYTSIDELVWKATGERTGWSQFQDGTARGMWMTAEDAENDGFVDTVVG